MNRLIISFITAITFIFSAQVLANNSDTAKLVIYSEKSRIKASFTVYAGKENLGRIKAGKLLTVDIPAGESTIYSSVKGSQPITINANAGETIYIDSELVKKGSGKYITTFEQVSEKIAVSSMPEIDGMI